MRRWLGRLTWPWLAAGSLLAFGAGFYFSVVDPARDDLAAMRRNLLALQQEIRRADYAPARPVQPAASTQLAQFYQFFPSERSLPDWMDKIFAAAGENELTLVQGEYQVSRESSGKLLRYQVTLPLKGTYPNIRGFIDGVLSEVPIASLDNVKFERQKIGENKVEATVSLTLYVGRES